MNLAPYSKLIAAVLGTLAATLTQLGLGAEVSQLIATILIGIATSFGVYRVPNKAGNVSSGTLNSPWLISILAVFLVLILTACASAPKVVYTAAEAGQTAITVSDTLYQRCLTAARSAADAAAGAECQIAKNERASKILDSATLLEGAATGLANTDGLTPAQMTSKAHLIMGPILGSLMQIATREQSAKLEAFR